MKVLIWFSITAFLIVTWFTESAMFGAVLASILFGMGWLLVTFFQSLKTRGRV
jgi:hypothetical protein